MAEKTISEQLEGGIFEAMKTVLSPLTAVGRFFLSDRANLGIDLTRELSKFNQQGPEAISRETIRQLSPLLQISRPGLKLRGLEAGDRFRGDLEQDLNIPDGRLDFLSPQTLQDVGKMGIGQRFNQRQAEQGAQNQLGGLDALVNALSNKNQLPRQEPVETKAPPVNLPGSSPNDFQQEFDDPGGLGVVNEGIFAEDNPNRLLAEQQDQPPAQQEPAQEQQAQLPPGLSIIQKMAESGPEEFQNFLTTKTGQDLFNTIIKDSVPTFKNILDQNKLLLDAQKFQQSQVEFNKNTELKAKDLALKNQELILKKTDLDEKKRAGDLDREYKTQKLAVDLQIQNMKNQAALAKIRAEGSQDIDKQANILRKEFIKADGEHQKRVDFYQQTIGALQGGDDTGVSDIALIFTFMKMLDPRSVVRETEQGMVVDSAGLEPKTRNLIESILRGKKLSDPVRGNILNRVNELHKKSLEVHGNTVAEYERLAGEFGVPKEKVIVGTFGGFDITDVPDSVLNQSPELKELAIKQLKAKLGEE